MIINFMINYGDNQLRLFLGQLFTEQLKILDTT